MAEKKTLTISDPWAIWKAYDQAELCPEAPSFGEYVGEDTSLLEKIRSLHRDKFTSNSTASGRSTNYTPGVVIKILSGKHANNDASTLGRETKSVSVRGTRPMHEEVSSLEGKKPTVRALVKLFCHHTADEWPEHTNDTARIDQFPEAIAIDPKIDENCILAPGSLVWVSLYNSDAPYSSPCGTIVNALSAPKPSIYDVAVSTKDGFTPKCASPLKVNGAGANYVANTVSLLENGPLVRRVKKKISLGVHGNGTQQTKSHFVASLLNSKKSVFHNMAGAADSYKNAFIWVGHLKNNGYMDYLDRPSSLGRETIIYAPKYFDTGSPFELIYYFHDRTGFGFPWIDGPKTTVAQAIANAGLVGNDFSEIIGPAIKDLTMDGRNFILVIPEMMHSRGFGTEIKNVNRIISYTMGQDVERGSVTKFAITQRVKPEEAGNDAARQALRTSLNQKFHSPNDTMSSLNRFIEREYSTFDNSFTGGNFAHFNTEVLNMLSSHLGVSDSGITTIVADGLSSLTLAAMSTLNPNPLEAVKPEKINYITNGEDFNDYRPIFSSFPSIAVFDNYFATAPGSEFNYITKYNASEKDNKFFNYINLEASFRSQFKPGAKGRLFTMPASVAGGEGSTGISLHLSSKPSTYGISFKSVSHINPNFYLRQRKSQQKVMMSEIPNHAANLSTKPSVAAMLEAEAKINSLATKNEFFDEFLHWCKSGGEGNLTASSSVCASYKIFCDEALNLSNQAGPGADADDQIVDLDDRGRLQTMYKDWYENFKEITKQEMIQEAHVEVSHVEKNIALLDDEVTMTDELIQISRGFQQSFDDQVNHFSKFRFSDWDPAVSKNAADHREKLKNHVRNSYSKEIYELKSNKLIELRNQFTDAQLAAYSDPDCATPATPLRLLFNTNMSGAHSSAGFIDCGSVRLPNPAPSSYAELGNIIPFYPTKEEFIDNNKNSILQEVKGFSLSGFKHLTRKANNKVSHLNTSQVGVKVWTCLVPLMERSWERACVASKYVPFRVAYGFRAEPTPNLKNTMSLHNLGLAIDVDPALNPSGNDTTAGVFTNSWKYGIGNSPEVDSLGIYSERFDDLSDNVYESSWFSGDQLMTTDNWDEAEGAHDDGSIGDYLTGMHKGNVVCPLQSNPLLWVLIFCETSGMKWCNSTFMRKRYRGGQRWSAQELYTIDKLFQIDNVVNRVNAISQRATKGEALNNHMQFQWWGNRSTISFEEIRQAAKINGVE